MTNPRPQTLRELLAAVAVAAVTTARKATAAAVAGFLAALAAGVPGLLADGRLEHEELVTLGGICTAAAIGAAAVVFRTTNEE